MCLLEQIFHYLDRGNVPCPGCDKEVNCTENVLRDVVTRGLADEEIQLDLLRERNQDMSLEEVLQFVEAKESGKRSAGRLLQTQGAEAIRSQYRRKQTADRKPTESLPTNPMRPAITVEN